jgi:hypothetical protein
VLLFVRSGETTPLFNHGRSSYGASHRRFQVLQASVQVAGILLKGSCKSHTIQDLRCDGGGLSGYRLQQNDSTSLHLAGRQTTFRSLLCLFTTSDWHRLSTARLFIWRADDFPLDSTLSGATDAAKRQHLFILRGRQTTSAGLYSVWSANALISTARLYLARRRGLHWTLLCCSG